MRRHELGLLFFSVAAAGMAQAGDCLADYQVTETKTSRYQLGTKISDSSELDVPEGASLRLLAIPGGKQILITGPYKGKIKDYAEPKRSWIDTIFGSDERENEEPVGGTRGLQR